MPFIYRNLITPPDFPETKLPDLLAEALSLHSGQLKDFAILRKAVDARKKPNLKLVYTLSFTTAESLRKGLLPHPAIEWQDDEKLPAFLPVKSASRIVIVGTGPAGLFAALRLAEHGLTATLAERGEPVEKRSLAVQRFWKDGILDEESNVQFGEGGAGTFSDGKLTCRSRDSAIPWILDRLAMFGANPEIRYLAKPHIGTDRLRQVVAAIRRYLQERGFTFRFGSRLSEISIKGGSVDAVRLSTGEELPCDTLILATGHSARDVFEILDRINIPLQRKPFAMGLRVEHPQELINRIQYGNCSCSGLPVAEYALTYNNETSGRSAYSFCMCPGGVVVGGASEKGGVVTNGMSASLRNSPYANSALVVNVRGDDFVGEGPLAGVRLQQKLEQQAFCLGGGGYRAPAQNMLDFLKLRGASGVRSSYRPGVCEADLAELLPPYMTATLREGIVAFGRKLQGFVTAEATLVGVESRTSSPVRILRGSNFESPGARGLYPAGEGAGYAGGIMSSAADGVRIADAIAARLA